VTLAVWWITSSPEFGEMLNGVFDVYEEANPTITIDATYYSYGDYVAAMAPALEAGTPPDLAFSDPFPPTLPNYIAAGHIQDLTEVAAEHGWADRLAPGMLDFYKPMHDNKIYGAPVTPAVRGFFYNKSILAEIGGEIPQTVEELGALAQTAKDAGYIPFGLGNQTSWSAEYYWLSLAYGNLASSDWEEWSQGTLSCQPGISWSRDEIRQGLDQFIAWERAGYFNEGYNAIAESDVHLEFVKGDMLAYYYSAASQNSALQADAPDFEVGFFNFPRVAAGTPLLSMTDPSNVLIIPNDSPHPDEALALIDWLLTPEVGAMLVENGVIPAHKVDVAGIEAPIPWMGDELAGLADQTALNWLNWSVPGLGDVTGPEVQLLLSGDTTVDAALQKFQETYDAACG
jgi:raffinose/stachyose/melibiose transport system substrate-binding protein